jgi:energy-coupling factor transporter ATP-binding protein EcfA2
MRRNAPVFPPPPPSQSGMNPAALVESLLPPPPPSPLAAVARDVEGGVLTLVTGPSGCGKTALLRAVARAAARRGDTPAAYLHALDVSAHAASDPVAVVEALACAVVALQRKRSVERGAGDGEADVTPPPQPTVLLCLDDVDAWPWLWQQRHDDPEAAREAASAVRGLVTLLRTCAGLRLIASTAGHPDGLHAALTGRASRVVTMGPLQPRVAAAALLTAAAEGGVEFADAGRTPTSEADVAVARVALHCTGLLWCDVVAAAAEVRTHRRSPAGASVSLADTAVGVLTRMTPSLVWSLGAAAGVAEADIDAAVDDAAAAPTAAAPRTEPLARLLAAQCPGLVAFQPPPQPLQWTPAHARERLAAVRKALASTRAWSLHAAEGGEEGEGAEDASDRSRTAADVGGLLSAEFVGDVPWNAVVGLEGVKGELQRWVERALRPDVGSSPPATGAAVEGEWVCVVVGGGGKGGGGGVQAVSGCATQRGRVCGGGGMTWAAGDGPAAQDAPRCVGVWLRAALYACVGVCTRCISVGLRRAA